MRRQEEKKGLRNYELALRGTTNCDFIPPLIPAQLRSPRPSFNPRSSAIHSSTEAFDGGRFFSPDFEEIYEPPRSDGLTDSLGGRAPRPVRKIVPYVYLKPYSRRALLVTSLISIIPIYRDATSRLRLFRMRRPRVYDGKLVVNTVYKTFHILQYSRTSLCVSHDGRMIATSAELASGDLAFRIHVDARFSG